MTPEEWANRLRVFEANAPRIIEACLKESAIQFEGEMTNRVFRKGEDENNTKIGKYSPAYAAYRRSKGKQTAYVDLQFNENLIRSIETVRIDGRAYAVKFKNQDQAGIAKLNEMHFKGALGTIFDISKRERERAIKVQQDRFDKEMKKWLGE